MRSDRAVRLALASSAALLSVATVSPAVTTPTDLVIADNWVERVGGDSVVWNDGFTGTYAGNPITVVTHGDGNVFADFSTPNPYWGQFDGQSWANPQLAPANFIGYNVIQLDMDFSKYTFWKEMVKFDLTTSGGASGAQTASTPFFDISRFLPGQLNPERTARAVGPTGVQRILIPMASLMIPRDADATSGELVIWLRPEYDGWWNNNYANPDGSTGSWRDTGNSFDSGQAVSVDKITLRSIAAGDANGDGKVDADDYALIDRGYGKSAGSLWSDGDFDQNGAVNAADYMLIDAAYAQQHGGSLSAGLLAERRSAFGDAFVAQLVAAVPEPGCVGVLIVGFAVGAALRGRRAR